MEQDIYGELTEVGRYSGRNIKLGGNHFYWNHGWLGPEYNTEVKNFIYQEITEKLTFLAWRQDQADFVQSVGVKKVAAIGSPFCYLDKTVIGRKAGSLLVMPLHSHRDFPQKENEKPYVEYIRSIAKYFSSVTVCCHNECFITGSWVPSFLQAGFNVIRGAEYSDVSTLSRMRDIFASHEYLNTNGYGSHWAYGSFFGCKVSAATPFLNFDHVSFLEANTRNSELIAKYKVDQEKLALAKKNEILTSEASLRKLYPQFFVEPLQASQQIEWGQFQMGANCVRSPEDIPRLFNYSFSRQLYWHLRLSLSATKKKLFGQPVKKPS